LPVVVPCQCCFCSFSLLVSAYSVEPFVHLQSPHVCVSDCSLQWFASACVAYWHLAVPTS
jgi:hypothetical protein